MRYGGIYDQIGYGFHRYSTDEKWLVPHFEKMLYDQALLIHSYLDAYIATKDKFYLDVVNGFVGSIADGEYINPQHAGDKLAEKLARVGLHFECPPLKGDEGKLTCEVKKHGGRFGKDTDGSDINDDGISHVKEGGLKLEVKHERISNGSFKVYAKLI